MHAQPFYQNGALPASTPSVGSFRPDCSVACMGQVSRRALTSPLAAAAPRFHVKPRCSGADPVRSSRGSCPPIRCEFEGAANGPAPWLSHEADPARRVSAAGERARPGAQTRAMRSNSSARRLPRRVRADQRRIASGERPVYHATWKTRVDGALDATVLASFRGHRTCSCPSTAPRAGWAHRLLIARTLAVDATCVRRRDPAAARKRARSELHRPNPLDRWRGARGRHQPGRLAPRRNGEWCAQNNKTPVSEPQDGSVADRSNQS